MLGEWTWKYPTGGEKMGGEGDCRAGASLDTTLHYPVLAVSPAGAGLVTLKN